VRSWSEPGAPAARALWILSSLLVGAILIAAPWTPTLWDLNSLIQPHPKMRAILLSPFTRGAVTGLGLVNVLLALHELGQLVLGRRE
jgi:hypothetical protein